jgi:hypothetical protein
VGSVTTSEPDSEVIEEGFLLATLRYGEEIEEHVRRGGLVLRGIYLRGTHPDTELVVECWDRTTSRKGSLTFGVWSTFVLAGKSMSAGTGAAIVSTNIMESAWD